MCRSRWPVSAGVAADRGNCCGAIVASARACVPRHPRHSYSQMSGVFFEYPDVRFSRRFRLAEITLRAFASLLFRRVKHAVRRSYRTHSRLKAAESPAVTQKALERLGWTLRGSRAVERASSDALRPNQHSVNPEDPYGISIIREKLAAPTGRRRVPTPGRRSPLPADKHSQSAGEKNAVGENHRLLFERKSADRAR